MTKIILGAILCVQLAAAFVQAATTAGQDLVKPNPAAPTANSGGGGVPEAPGSDKIPSLPTPSMDSKNQAIMNSLVSQAGWFPEVTVSVKNGMVTIDGKAKNREQLDWLAKTADRLPSVIAVINKAQLIEPPMSDFTPAINELKAITDRAKRALPSILLTAVFFAIFFFSGRSINRLVEKIWGRHIDNPFLLSTVSKITMLPIWLIFFYLALQVAGLSGLATTIIGGTGVIGIVFGFAFKDIAENYLAGLLLAFRSPFTKSDLIQVGEYLGYVQGLAMRGTTIIDPDGNLILIPNTVIIGSVIRNYTANPNSRLSFNITIGYGDSLVKAQEAIAKVLASADEILKEPAPMVLVDDVGGGGGYVKLRVLFWFDASKSGSLRVKSKAIALSKEALLAVGIGVPSGGSTTIVFGDTLKVHNIETKEDLKADQEAKKQKMIDTASASISGGQPPPAEDNRAHKEEVQKLFDWAKQSGSPALEGNLVEPKANAKSPVG